MAKNKNNRKRSRQRQQHEKNGQQNDDPAHNLNNQRNTTSQQTYDASLQKRKRGNNDGNSKKNKKMFVPPSEAALALSAQLKELSSKKRLKEALDLYNDSSNDDVRDLHHGSIVVDCCARCGAVEEGEKIVKRMKESGMKVSVQANTALLKGYAHSGLMMKGSSLYKSMCDSSDKRNKPNVRTLNTLLRGCLWTAASTNNSPITNNTDNDETNRQLVAGGIVTSEEAWRVSFQSALKHKSSASTVMLPDSSSYEYSVSLLCQALLCDEAEKRIQEMKHTLNPGNDNNGVDSNVDMDENKVNAESFAVALASLARAYALLGKREEASKNAKGALKAIDAVMAGGGQGDYCDDVDNNNDADGNSKGGKSRGGVVIGGKRAWRRQDDDQSGNSEVRRTSNMLFRNHRLSELKSEASKILELCKHPLATEKEQHALAMFLVKRLLYFSGGGTTDLSATRENSDNDNDNGTAKKRSDTEFVRQNMINSLWLSFGLSAAVGRYTNAVSYLHSEKKSTRVLSKKDRAVLQEFTPNQESVISDDGYIDFAQLFSAIEPNINESANDGAGKNQERLLNIELGAGSGDWIVSQARANPSQDYVSVELRADRVAQTFSKCLLNASVDGSNTPLQNVCCVGSECGSFLRERVREKSISTIYVNHPEPPTQTYGLDEKDISSLITLDDEPAHMLNSKTLLEAIQCLKSDGQGKLIIVTDNRWYARLICFTLQKVMRRNAELLSPLVLDTGNKFRIVEVFRRDDNGGGINSRDNDIILYEGKPSNDIGHMTTGDRSRENAGTSYFDRLWRTGAGSHAEIKRRFIIALKTYDGTTDQKSGLGFDRSDHQKSKKINSGYQKKSLACEKKKKANKKKSAAKQQRRNERRLAKKKATAESASKKT